jgi:deoxyribose-phosphate aldolase
MEESTIKFKLEEIFQSEIGSYSRKELYKLILNTIDLTTLEGSDNKEKIIALCQQAKGFRNYGAGFPDVAAVCVYPVFVKLAKEQLQNTGIHVASVAGAFPSSQSPLRIKCEEVAYAIEEGADEIDMVISRGKLLEGNFSEVFDEIASIKSVCGKAKLKVILETGELQTFNNIKKASEIAIEAGADFIKTSTGKISVSATPEAAYIMCSVIRDHYLKTGKKIGFKAAGGISDVETALNYLKIVNTINGKEWLNNGLFRFGASRLATKVLDALLEKNSSAENNQGSY